MQGQNQPAKLLIVDDEKINLDTMVGLLGPHYKTVVALNGEQALKRLKRPPLPDLILLDVVMPDMDGYEVCRIIKEDPATRHIPVIFITGKNEEQDEAKGFQAGAVDYISKPFSPIIGLARVSTHIELKRRGDMLERLAGLDGLTGIANRRRFDEFLSSEWKRCQRHAAPISLILADIDFFKRYNDYYGHAKGDAALKQVAAVISQSTPRPEDLAARYGGEEFVCVLPQTGSKGARTVAERIMKSLEHMAIAHADSKAASRVTLSIGVASLIPAKGQPCNTLVELADAALYEAKRKGRNRISVSPGG
jgi:diguanylate cyclase (GGDEF)-like protein